MNIITRKEARILGLKYYYTGKPCIRGHITERLTTRRYCMDCHKEDSSKWSIKHIDYRDEYNHKYYKENTEYYNEYTNRWMKEHSHRWVSIVNKRKAAKLQRTPSWASFQKIEEVYLEAYTKTQETGIKYVVDHIIPLQGKYVSGLHVENNLQVITHIANCKKYNRYTI
jgi:hypothetical protein